MALVIHYEKLRAEKAYRGLTYTDIAAAAGKSQQTLAEILTGRGSVNLQSLHAVAAALGLGVVIDFVPLDARPADLAGRVRELASQERAARAAR